MSDRTYLIIVFSCLAFMGLVPFVSYYTLKIKDKFNQKGQKHGTRPNRNIQM